MNKLLAIGEALVDMIPGQVNVGIPEVETFQPIVGGAPANVCGAFVKLGGEAEMITQLGDDPFGNKVVAEFDRFGIGKQYVKRTDKANTALAFVALKGDGNREFSFYRRPSADMLMSAEDVKEEWFKEWIEKEVIKGYALYDNKQKIVECTICGNTFNNSKTFRNSELICPKCRSTLKALPKGHFRINDEGYCAFAQLCNTGLVVRYFQWRNSRASNGNQRKFVTEYRRDFIDSNNDIKSYVYSSYKLSGYIGFIPFENRMGRMGYYGYMEPYAGFTRNAKFWFKGRKHLKNSPYEYAILSKQYQTFLLNLYHLPKILI